MCSSSREICLKHVRLADQKQGDFLQVPRRRRPKRIPLCKLLQLPPLAISVANTSGRFPGAHLLTDTPHPKKTPSVSTQACMYDTCACEDSEDCMCAALSAYVFACASAGVRLQGWRKTVCGV